MQLKYWLDITINLILSRKNLQLFNLLKMIKYIHAFWIEYDLSKQNNNDSSINALNFTIISELHKKK